MKICIDLTPIYDHLTGIERYNINIAKTMIKNHCDDYYILIFKNEVHYEFKDIIELKNVEYKIIQGHNKLIFIQFRLNHTLYSIDADFYLFLSFTSPIFFRKNHIINAIHDLTCWDCPETINRKMVFYYRLTYRIAIKRSWKVITVSKFSQKQICKRYKVPKNFVPVIYDGLSDVFVDPKVNKDILEKYNIPKNYILSLSTLEPRKNLQLLIQAYEELIKEGNDLPELVLAGRKGWKIDEIFKSISYKAKNKIHFTGFVEDSDLSSLYKFAKFFVFPSKYEGFGLPVIEAMSQGTLVLSSDAASLPEILNNKGLLFKSEDIIDLKSKLIKANDGNLSINREDLIQYAKSFDWNVESDKLWNLMVKKNV